MANVKFYRGVKAGYALLSSTIKNTCIYFTTDTNEIIVDGKVYGDRDIKNIFVPVQIDESQQINISLAAATQALSEALIEMGGVVNNRQEKLIAGANVNISNDNVISVDSIQESYLIWGGPNKMIDVSPIDALLDEYHAGNRFAAFTRSTVTITREYSTNSGNTWTPWSSVDGNGNDTTALMNKRLFIGDTGDQYPNFNTGTGYNGAQKKTGQNRGRLTVVCNDGSTALVGIKIKKIIVAMGTSSYIYEDGDYDFMMIEGYKSGNWETICGWTPLRGYPGYDVINLDNEVEFGTNGTYLQIRFTIKGSCSVAKLKGYGSYCNGWIANNIAMYNRPYKLDDNGNAAFQASVTQNSDERLKENITKITNNTDMPNIYEFDVKETGEHAYGVIAQELEKNYPELVLTSPDNVIIDPETNKEIKREAGYKSVKYWETHSMMLAKLCNKIKQLENEIAELKNIQQESEVNDETE